MRLRHLCLLVIASAMAAGTSRADRPVEKRDNADLVIVGTVRAVYARDTEGYKEYIVELAVEEVAKGFAPKKGEAFRAFCYQRKAGKGGLEFDSEGHTAVPREGERIKAFVNRAGGRHEGVYPNWFDAQPAAGK